MLDEAWRELDADLLTPDGRLRIQPAAFFANTERQRLRLWCHFRGVYQLPTTELVEWMQQRIGARSALEVGAGRGWLGRALGVRATDNHCQSWPDVRAVYAAMGQPVTEYGTDVECIAANPAIAKYRPEVVFGCWVTQWADPQKRMPPGGGSVYGIDEHDVLRRVQTYIVVGNDAVHGKKEITARSHETVRAAWLWSRATYPEQNAIYVWDQ